MISTRIRHLVTVPEKRNIHFTVKPVLSGHLKIFKTKVLVENGSLMKVKNIAEHSAILLTCIKR